MTTVDARTPEFESINTPSSNVNEEKGATNTPLSNANGEKGGVAEKRELREDECYEKLGYCWPKWKKWTYLVAVACVQVSMNFNTSVYPSAVPQLSEEFNISHQHARVGQMIYLVTYSVGCELWAPWSEEFGRWPILQLSMFLINIWQIPAALAQNWGTIIVARGLVSIPQHIYIYIHLHMVRELTQLISRVVFLQRAAVLL